jgi:hypothetical protein
MSVVTQLYFQIVEEINYMFRLFSGWAIIRLRLEYRRKLIYYNVDIKNGETRSRFTMFGEVHSYIYRVWCYRRCVAIYTGCGICENTVVLRQTFIHLISTSIESNNRDDATRGVFKVRKKWNGLLLLLLLVLLLLLCRFAVPDIQYAFGRGHDIS